MESLESSDNLLSNPLVERRSGAVTLEPKQRIETGLWPSDQKTTGDCCGCDSQAVCYSYY